MDLPRRNIYDCAVDMVIKAGKKVLIVALVLYVLKGIAVTTVLLWAFLF
jgi:hypothetical protein